VRKEALNVFLSVPNSSEKKICAFLTKRSKIIDTIIEDDFHKYKEKKDLKILADKYDFFISTAPMMSKIATKFGRVFGPLGKMPSPQGGIVTKEDEETVSAMVEKMNKMIRVRNKEASIKLAIGKEDMEDKQIIENINSLLTQLESKLPRGKENIKNAMVKMTMTKSIKFLDNVNNK
jgi:large subunit ribosomal protein L1